MRRRTLYLGGLLWILAFVPGSPARAAEPGSSRSAVDLLAPQNLWVQAEVGPDFALAGGPPALLVSPRIGLDAMQANGKFGILAYLPVSLRFQSAEVAGTRASAFGLEVGLAARLRLLLHPLMRPYLDMGVGVSTLWATVEQPFVGSVTASATSLAFHGAVGIEVPFRDRLAFYVEPLGLSASTAGGSAEYVMLVGVGYRLGAPR